MRDKLIAAARAIVLCAAGLALAVPAVGGEPRPLKERWFFVHGYGCTPQEVANIKVLVDTAAAHGLNGMVLASSSFDTVTRWEEKDVALLKELEAYCSEKKIELIPCGLSVGYGYGALAHDRSFAAALPAKLNLVAENGKLVADTGTNLFTNGDFEVHAGDRFKGYAFQDSPGKISLADSAGASGATSIRFENFGADAHGHGRIMQKVRVRPGRAYRFTFKIKTQDLQPVGGLQALVLAQGRSLAEVHPKVKPTQEWSELSLSFINTDEKEVKVYAGIWGGKSGKFWLDDFSFCESGDLSDIVRREGTPLTLKSVDRDASFAEGKDFGEIPCRRCLDAVPLPPGSAILAGEHLELSCYKIPYVDKQINLCMSNPKLFTYWEEQARRLHELIPFKRFILSMDEIRNGGGCLTCRNRGMSMAQILGDCVTRQRDIFKRINPSIEVMIWSDMLDPAHNARDRYYGVVGSFEGSWKYVPNDLTIICWYHKIRDTSLSFFSKQGFRTFGAAYYDTNDLTSCKEWQTSLLATPLAEGIMYTTFRKNYDLLPGFGDLVSSPQKP